MVRLSKPVAGATNPRVLAMARFPARSCLNILLLSLHERLAFSPSFLSLFLGLLGVTRAFRDRMNRQSAH